MAAPKYPLSSTSLPGAGGDVVNQPADVTFLITEVVRRSSDPASSYARLVDGSRVAVAGHSLGAMTSLGVAYNGCCVDNRIKAAVSLAGAIIGPFPADKWFPGGNVPLLVVHGDDDKIVRIEDGKKVFDNAPAPKAMLTVIGGDHNRPYGGSLTTTDNPERLGAEPSGPTQFVNAAVVGFLDRYLKDDGASFERVRTALADEIDVHFDVAA